MEDTGPFEEVTFEEVTGDDPKPAPPEEEKEPGGGGSSDETQTQEEDIEEEEEETITDEEEEEETEEDTEREEKATEETEEEEQEEESVSVIEALQSQTGIQTEGDYDDNLEGAAEYINDAVQEQTQQQLNQVVESLPEDVQQYMNFRSNGGDPEEFMQAFASNWNDTELQEDDPNQHETIVRNRMREEGYDDETIDDAIEDYKTSGNLYGEAQRSLDRLQKIEEQQQQELVNKQEQQRQDQEDEIEEAWDEIESTLNDTSELNGLPVPEAKKDEFYNWMSEPVEEVNGQPVSQRDMAAQEADLETLLTLDYVLYLMHDDDLSFSEVIDNKAKSKKAEDLENLLEGSKKDKPSNKTTGPSGDGSSDEVDADQLPDATELIG